MGQWILEFETFRDFEAEVELRDESGAALNIAGWFIKFEIKHDDATIVQSTVTGHVTILTPTTNGKFKLAVPKTEILGFPFTWAAFKFFAGPDAGNPDLIYEGRASRT